MNINLDSPEDGQTSAAAVADAADDDNSSSGDEENASSASSSCGSSCSCGGRGSDSWESCSAASCSDPECDACLLEQQRFD